MDDNTKQEFNKQLTDEMIQRLAGYALRLANTRYWWGLRGGDELPDGETADSVVSRVIVKLLDGSNNWDPTEVSLYVFLQRNIQREIGHLAKSKENRFTVHPSEDPTEPNLFDSGVPATDGSMLPRNPGEIAQDQERDAKWDQFLSDFYCSLGDEPELIEIINGILDLEKPRQTAKKLGWSIKTYQNAKRRLGRRLKSFREKYDSRQTERQQK